MIFGIEKSLKEAEGKISDEDKKTLEDEIAKAKTDMQSDDINVVKGALDSLVQKSQTIFGKMYQGANPNPNGDSGANGNETNN